MSERWVFIPGEEGRYQASSTGRVRSVDRVVQTRSGVSKRVKGRVLKSWRGSSGYEQVYLGRGRPYLIHHLILLTFHGIRPEGTEGRHGNGNPLDNSAENLSWSTHSENELDKQVHGTHWQRNKVTCPNEHLLQEPNLVESRKKKGFRLCKSCSQEYYSARDQCREFDVAKADDRYDRLLI